MNFHGRSNPGKNKCSIGYRHKQGKNFQLHKNDVEEEGQAADPDPDCADPDLEEPPPTKKEQSDNNWWSVQGIVAREKKGGNTLLAAGCSG